MTHSQSTSSIDQREAALYLLKLRQSSASFHGFMSYYYDYTWESFQKEMQEVLDLLEKDALLSKGGNPIRRVLVTMPPRHAKLLADDTPILTPSGWVTHGDLKVGDFVFGSDGRPTRITATTGKSAADVRVTMSDGASFLCNEDHLWTVYNRSQAKWITVPTSYWLTPSKKTGNKRQLQSAGRQIFQIPNTPPIVLPDALLELHPYALGAWLGDGTGSKPAITHHETDMEVIDAISAMYPISCSFRHVVGDCRTFTTHFGSGTQGKTSEMTKALKAIGVLKNKHIPRKYMMASVEQRLELLAGLIDTGGSVDKNGRVRIVTVVERLRDDYMELTTSLGFRPYLMKQSPSENGKHDVYSIGFQPTRSIPTRIKRKAINNPEPVVRMVGIVSVERVGGDAIGHCITVENQDGLYLAGRNLTVTHNSMHATINFPAYALMRKPFREVMVSSYNNDLASTFGRATREIVTDPKAVKAFKGFGLSKETRAVDFWKTDAGGAYYSVGLGGTTTGRGACLTGDTKLLVTTGRDATRATAIRDVFNSPEPLHVLAYDHKTQSPAWGRVNARSEIKASELFEISDSSGGVIEATGEHPFYVVERGYVKAESIAPGDHLLRLLPEDIYQAGVRGFEVSQARAPCSREEDRVVVVSMVKRVRRECLVYNLSVEGFENYFANGVLTHNCLLIVDDPYKSREEADSITLRRKVWDFYTSGLISRLQPDKSGQPAMHIVCQTRWHPDDLAGRVIESKEFKAGEWTHLNFQALKKKERGVYIRRNHLPKDDPRYVPNLTLEQIETGERTGAPTKALLNDNLVSTMVEVADTTYTALWPKRFPVEWLLKQKSILGDRDFESLYQQNPYILGGNLIREKWFKRYNRENMPESFHALAITVDTAFKAKTSSDYSVFTVGGITELGDIYILRVYRDKLEFPDLKRKAVQLHSIYRSQGMRGLWVEDNASGQSLIQELRSNTGIPVLPWKPGATEKYQRAASVTPLIDAGRVFIPDEADWLDEWISELSSFPSVKHDDQVDSFVMLLDVMSRMVVTGMKEFSEPIGDIVAGKGFKELLFAGQELRADPHGWVGTGGFGKALSGFGWKGWGH